MEQGKGFRTEESEILKENFVNYEKAITKLFRDLELTPVQSGLIRALLIASKGKVEFETSKLDLAKIMFKYDADGEYPQNLVNKVSYAIGKIKEWQDKSQVNLVQILEIGGRVINKKTGKYDFVKSKYKFVLLAELTKAIYANPNSLNKIAEGIIANLKRDFVPVKKSRELSQNKRLEMTRKTIFTSVKNCFQLAVGSSKAPYNYCQKILDDCQEVLLELNKKYKTKMNRDKFIFEFESQLGHPVENPIENSMSN